NAKSAHHFLQAVRTRTKEIPNLISPHLGDRVSSNWAVASAVFGASSTDDKSAAGGQTAPAEKPAANVIAALPLGGRIKVDPWNDQLHMRSEEHTSELQSLRHLVCRLLLEKKKNKKRIN